MSRRIVVALACLAQLALVGVAVGDRLSARLTGEEYLLRVAPVDPVDPFRGAYVALRYPDLPERADARPRGTDVFIPLVPDGEVWKGTALTYTRPQDQPYLTCTDRDWTVSCGIESYFLPQDEARDLERTVASGDAVATVRVDSRGHAALVAVETR